MPILENVYSPHRMRVNWALSVSSRSVPSVASPRASASPLCAEFPLTPLSHQAMSYWSLQTLLYFCILFRTHTVLAWLGAIYRTAGHVWNGSRFSRKWIQKCCVSCQKSGSVDDYAKVITAVHSLGAEHPHGRCSSIEWTVVMAVTGRQAEFRGNPSRLWEHAWCTLARKE